MGKYTWRWLIAGTSGFDYAEAMLEDYARKGLLLEHTFGAFGKFEKTAPCEVRYRFEPIPPNAPVDPDEDYLQLYSAQGWELADTCGERYYIFMTRDPAAPELHTDPELQAYALRREFRRTITGMILVFLWVAVAVGLLLHRLFRDGTPLLTWLGTGAAVPAIIFVVLVITLADYVFNIGHFLRLYRSLKRGEPMEHRPPYLVRTVLAILFFVFAIACCFLRPIARHINPGPQDVNFQDYGETLFFPTLGELEGKEDYAYLVSEYKGTNYGNYLTVWSDPLAPTMLTLKQVQAGSTNRSGGYLFAEYYELRKESLAQRALLERRTADSSEFTLGPEPLALPVGWDGSYAEIVYPETHNGLTDSTEDFYHNQAQRYQFLYLRFGCRVLKLCYHGSQELREQLPLVIDAMSR